MATGVRQPPLAMSFSGAYQPGPQAKQARRGKVKSSCYSPNFIEQAAHCDHKPRAAWVYVRLLLHRHSAAGWAECVIYSALVSFF